MHVHTGLTGWIQACVGGCSREFLDTSLPHSSHCFILIARLTLLPVIHPLPLQSAFSLYGPLRARGCSLVNSGITCESEEEEHRAMALATLHFSTLLFGTTAFVLLLYGCIAGRARPPQRRLRSAHSDMEGGQEMAGAGGVLVGIGNGVGRAPNEPFKVAYEIGEEDEEDEEDESLLMGNSKLGVTP